jgi:superfamily II DNA or RNA helicase
VRRWRIDEAHHVLRENKWGHCAGLFTNAEGEGYTASPSRADGKGLGSHTDGIFDDMVCGPTMRQLINIGALSDYEIATPKSDFHIDDEDLAPSGDWSSKRMREASKRSHIVGDVVTEYAKRAFGKRAICFATDVETAHEMAQNFNAVGIPAAAVSAKTPADVREDYIRRFRAGQFWILVNVDLFGEGFDVPAVEVVIMARPTASLAVYLQQFGRALRILAGKPYGLVIDHVSNWKRHGFPDKPHAWTLDRREKRGKRERDPLEVALTACRGCSKPYDAVLPACPHCGWSPPLPEPGKRTIEAVAGDLFLIDRERAAAMREAINLPSPADVGNRAAHVAGPIAGQAAARQSIERHGAQQRLRAAIEQWAGVRRAVGEDDQIIYRRFYATIGSDVLSVQTLPRVDMERIAERVEGWYNACF